MSIIQYWNSSFLHEAAKLILDHHDHGDNINECLILFPTRRSILFFRKAMAEIAGKPVWAPQMFTLDSWIKNQFPGQLTDELALIIRLHKCWQEMGGKESFESFYTLGQILIKDFNAIDEALVDRTRFFADLRSIQNWSEEDIEHAEPDLADLIRAIKNSSIAIPLKDIWSSLERLYNSFYGSLEQDGLSTGGRIYRQLAEEKRFSELALKYSKVYFIGFYQLLKVEQLIVNQIPNAVFIWNKSSEVVSKSLDWVHPLEKFIETHAVESISLTPYSGHEVQIRTIAATGTHNQLQTAAGILSDKDEEYLSSTVIVLPGQGLLLPLLQVMPSHIQSLNVSMGLSIIDTPVFTLIQQFLQCIESWKEGTYVDSRLVKRFFNNRYLSSERRELDQEFLKEQGSHYWHKDGEWLNIPEFWRYLLSVSQSQLDILARLLRFLEFLHEEVKEEIDQAAVYFLYIRLQRLRSVLTDQTEQWTSAFFLRFLRRILQHSRITLMGEPLKGLQVLGFQELANLNFRHVIILESNEGSIPHVNHSSSIPFTLGKMYDLHGLEEQLQAQEYLFWTLLQGAEQVDLLYTTGDQGISKSEPSRWLMRLWMDLKPECWYVTRSTVKAKREKVAAGPIALKNSSEVRENIREWLSEGRISPTAISSWLTCRLKFYLEQILRFKEKEDTSEEIDALQFGTVFHDVMEQLFIPFKGKTLQETEYTQLTNQLSEVLNERYCHHLRIPYKLLQSGSHRIFRDAIEKAVLSVIYFEKTNLPLTVFDTEIELKSDYVFKDINLHLYGKVDRIDIKDENYRIIDYKTGKFYERKLKSTYSKIWERDGKSPGEALQALFYAWLFHRIYPNLPVPEIHLYFVSGTSKTGKTKVIIDGNDDITNDLLNRFEEGLLSALGEMLSEDLVIDQTTVIRNCNYCPYKNLCGK